MLTERNVSVRSSIVIAAFCAGCTEAILTPFERIQTLMLDHKWSGQFRNTPHAFVSLTQYGVREYYRGSVILVILSLFMIFSSLSGSLQFYYEMGPVISYSLVVGILFAVFFQDL